FVALLRAHGSFPERSTYPGDPPERGITVMQDGMLHPARNRPSCMLATDSCYRRLPPPDARGAAADAAAEPAADTAPAAGAGGRPCRAREKGHTGCAGDTDACRT